MSGGRASKGAGAALRMIGLAARAGALRFGTERVREAARAGELHFVVVAADASANTQDKLIPMLEARRVPYAVVYQRDELGAAAGRGPLGAVGLADRSLAERVRDLLVDSGVVE